MRYSSLFEEQPRWMELAAIGLLLLIAVPLCAVLTWMGIREALAVHGRPASAIIQLLAFPLGLYALILARRLLRRRTGQAMFLVSPAVLVAMGIFLLWGAYVEWRWTELGWSRLLTNVTLGVACLHLAMRRRRRDKGAASRTDGA
jgi:hypothetical protein